jgi:octaprenyl-diphosphate synthase
LGKTIGKDLCEGKITLPLFHLLSACDTEERAAVERIIEQGWKQGGAAAQDLGAIIGLMARHNSVSYAIDRSRHFVGLAVEELRAFPPSSHRDALELIADYVVSRDH